MAKRDYEVLEIPLPSEEIGSRTWTEQMVREHLDAAAYDGLALYPGAGLKLRDVEFLRDYPALRWVSLGTKVRNDTGVFALKDLRELAIDTFSKVPVPECRLEHLQRLALRERPGIEARKWPELEEFLLDPWTSGDCSFLTGAERVRDVELRGTDHAVVLDGIQDCARLERLRIVEASVRDLGPLRGLDGLRELRMVSRTAPHGSLDLADLSSPALETLWLGGATELRNLDALAGLPALRELRLIDCPLTDADRAVLGALPDRVAVELVG